MLRIKIPDAHLLIFKKDNIRKALRESAALVIAEARALTRNAGGSGRVYSTPSTMSKGYHQASAPGQPPASLTGKLASSIRTKSRGESVTVTDTAYYSKFLELGSEGGGGTNLKGGKGTRNQRKRKNQPTPTPSTRRVLAPRPFLSRALDDHKDEIEAKIIAAVEADLKMGK